MIMENNDFKLTLPIEKSYTREVDGEERMYIAGLASGVELDHDDERMSESAIQAFKAAIDEGIFLEPNNTWSLVPLRSGHRKEWDDILGWITKAEVDENHQLWIEAELNNTSNAKDLYTILTTPQKKGRPIELGFSIGGKIKKASREWNQQKQKSIRVFDEIALGEVSIVGKPSYVPSFVDVLTKSVNWDGVPKPQQEITKENPMSQETNDLNKEDSNVSVADTSEKAIVADPQIEDQNAILKSLVERLEAIETKIAQTPVVAEKAVEVETKPEVAKTDQPVSPIDVDALQKSIATSLASAITTALSGFKTDAIDPVVAELTAVKATVQEMSTQPVDKSHAVRIAKETTDDAVEQYHANLKKSAENNMTPNYIGEAVKLAVRQ